MKRYNFKLVESKHIVNTEKLPKPLKTYDERILKIYGNDASRFAGFEELENPSGALKFLNKIWNLELKSFDIGTASLQGIDYYKQKQKYHCAIALVRKVINQNKALSVPLLDILHDFIPYIITEIKCNEKQL